MTTEKSVVVTDTKPAIEVRAAVASQKVLHTTLGVGSAIVIGAAIGIGSGLKAGVAANGGHVPKWLESLL